MRRKPSIVSQDVIEALSQGKSTGDKKFDREVKKQYRKDIKVLKERDKVIWK